MQSITGEGSFTLLSAILDGGGSAATAPMVKHYSHADGRGSTTAALMVERALQPH